MKQYTVYFKEPISRTYPVESWNKETKTWETGEKTETADTFTFYSLAPAKALIKKHIDKYAGSSITKTWANGDWENLGEIKLTGNNKHFIANTRQTKAGY